MPVSENIAVLFEDFSLEMTAKDIAQVRDARQLLPPGTRVNVTFLGNESPAMRVTAARAVLDLGLVPVPHVSARRLPSHDALDEFLGALHAEGATQELFVIAGDPTTPHGPYEGALELLRTQTLDRYGVRQVGIAGYPEGHPHIDDDVLWSHLERKAETLREQGLNGVVITQFGFDADAVLGWVEQARARGIDIPIRIGVPGPAGVRRLLTFAKRFGVGSSALVAKKYGLSLTNLLGTAGPDRFIDELAERYDAVVHGRVHLHFYTFGGIRATSEWIVEHRGARSAA
jgi:methylenetetrahydrofolate reductase (NADPH)